MDRDGTDVKEVVGGDEDAMPAGAEAGGADRAETGLIDDGGGEGGEVVAIANGFEQIGEVDRSELFQRRLGLGDGRRGERESDGEEDLHGAMLFDEADARTSGWRGGIPAPEGLGFGVLTPDPER